MIWPRTNITINGKQHTAIAPIIISASRATDIPAFYSKEFIQYLRSGYVYWTNPFNTKKSLISFKKTELIVFWSKNPAPLVSYLDEINDSGIDYYFNFTLNNYEKEGYEKYLPPLETRINTFIKLAEKVGKEKLIWRFDPIILADNQNIDVVVDKIEQTATKLKNHTNKLVFSFIDSSYKKVKSKLKKANIKLTDFDSETKRLFAEKLVDRLSRFKFTIASCAEAEDLSKFNIKPNKCIDNELISKNFTQNNELISFIEKLGVKNQLKDKGQRKYCECIVSKDIGRYNTCGYSCIYCYAMQQDPPKLIKDIFN